MLVTSMSYAIQVLMRAGIPEGAALAAGAALDSPTAFFGTLPAHERPHHETALARIRDELGEDRYNAQRTKGATTTLDDVVAELVRAIDDAAGEIRDRAR